MKKLPLILFLLSTVALQAQTVTKEKIIGIWKPAVAEFEDKRLDISDTAAFLQFFIDKAREESEDGVISEEDSLSTIIEALNKLNAFASLKMEFLKNGKFAFTAPGDNTAKGVYTVTGNKLKTVEDDGPEENLDIAMPDDDTLIIFDEDVKLTLTRKK